MKLTQYDRWSVDPTDGLSDLRQEMSRLFDYAFPNLSRFTGLQANAMPVDLYRDENNYYVRAELPGVAKEDIKVEFEDGWLKLTGTYRREESAPATDTTKEGEAQATRVESANAERQVRVPENVATDRIAAKYENGVLTLTLPLREEAKPRSIDIKIG
ncbi:MAG: Hsp20/alpha crystallin family protein [Verrucomicrobiota bacterium]